MGTTADKLTYLSATKDTLKASLTGKGVEVPEGTTFRRMAEMVGEIPVASTHTVGVTVTDGVYSITIDGQTLYEGGTYDLEAQPGEYIYFGISSDVGWNVHGAETGIGIPTANGRSPTALTRVPPTVTDLYFIMPDEDVLLEGGCRRP